MWRVARREKEVGCVGACMSCRGCVQANSGHLEDEQNRVGNPVYCLAALRRSGKAKQL